jgi:acyl-CoA synthetase (AMP-forming)/AMP-acid ligase II
MIRPFDETDVRPDAAGVRRYTRLAPSVVALLRSIVEDRPQHEAVVELDGPRMTYRQLWDAAARVAGGLRADGVGRGDRVAIRHGNGLEWVLGFFGTMLAGGIPVPLNTRLAAAETAYILADCAPTTVLGPGGPRPDGPPFAVEDLRPEEVGAIFYTSGTTGFPKGAMLTHENFCANAENSLRVRQIPRGDPTMRNLISVPLFHVTGCNSQLLSTLANGGTQVVMPAFDVPSFLRAIATERIRAITAVPAIYWYVLSRPEFRDFDLSGVHWSTYGGAPIAPPLVRQIRAAFPNARVGNGFGLTETTSVSTFLPHEFAESHAESVGFAAPTVELAVDGPDGLGELLIRGANVAAGYWNKPKETAEAFVDGWFHSGDMARVDADGRVYIVDRIKDMINRGGENVYCVEVENVLAGAPGVFEVAVIGVADEMMGEKVGAVLVPTPGRPLDTDAVLRHAREHLADFKVPQYVAVRDEPLPRNPGGKVLKPLLRNDTVWSA